MLDRIIYTGEMLALVVAVIVAALLPIFIAMGYRALAFNGRSALHPDEFDRIERRTLWIVMGGYGLLLAAFFFITAPAPAHAGVNAASIVRAKCKRTPPELRSLKCIRLVGTN